MQRDPHIQYLPAGGSPDQNLSKYYVKNRAEHGKTIARIIEEQNIDVVFGANLLPTIGAFKHVKKMRKNGKKCIGVYDFSDFFPQSAAIYSEGKLSASVVKFASNLLFKKNLKLADCVTAVSAPLYDYAKGFGCKHVELVTNGVEIARFTPDIDASSIRQDRGLGTKVLGFVGALERWIDLDIPLRAFPKILKKIPDAQFLIVGGSIRSGYEKHLHSLVEELGISNNVIFTGFVPYEEVPRYINAMDVTLIPFRTGLYMADIALPDKFFEYMACGKPIISTKLPEVERVGGKAVHIYEAPEDLVEKTIELLSSPTKNVEGVKIASKYDWKKMAGKLTDIFAQRLGEQG